MACVPFTWDTIEYTFDSGLRSFDETEICDGGEEPVPPVGAVEPTFNLWDVQLVTTARKRKRADYRLLLLG